MDRRNFIKSLLASGVLGSSPMTTQAASKLFKSRTESPVTIIGQSGLPHAGELVARLERVFAAAGINRLQITSTAGELNCFPYLASLLDRMAGSRLICVMDDAAATVFQEAAAARGAVCTLSTHHRFTGQEVRHCCTPVGLEGNVVWSDALSDHAGRIARLYAGMLCGPDPAGNAMTRAAEHLPGAPLGTPGSLVSFLINV